MLSEHSPRRQRRRYTNEFKADAVSACLQPGVSIASVALSRGLNANLLRRWIVEHDVQRVLAKPNGGNFVTKTTDESPVGFIPVALPAQVSHSESIRIELRCVFRRS